MGRNTKDFQSAAANSKILLYRGLEDITHPNQIDANRLGVHWTPSYSSAEEFAIPTWAKESEDLDKVQGAIIHAEIDPKHIMEMGTPEMEGAESWRMPESHWEQEKTLRPGSPVKILKIETLNHNNATGEVKRVTKRNAPKQGTV
jgi:hypothetical protein